MKLRDRSQVENLAKFKVTDNLVTSFFLGTDKARQIKKEIGLSLRHLLETSRERLEALAPAKKQKESLIQDLDRIGAFCNEQIVAARSPGLAVFCCSASGFWQDFSLPEAPRNRVVFEKNFFVKPLSAILDEHRLICTLLVDRKEAQWYEVAMDEGRLLESLKSDVPAKVKPAGFLGYNAKNIERHVNAHIHEHFKKAAQMTFDLLKKRPFDWLFIGTGEEHRSGLESILHRYVKERLAAWIKSKPSSSADQVLKETVEVERSLKKKEEESLVARLIAEIEKDGRAVTGIKDTLDSLNRYRVMTLVVTRDYSAPGFTCRSCGRLYFAPAPCPECGREMEPVEDVVDEAVEAALTKNVAIRHVTPPSRLDRFGKIGAFLKY
jgi:peptide subunit release factor 1 (eRF1)